MLKSIEEMIFSGKVSRSEAGVDMQMHVCVPRGGYKGKVVSVYVGVMFVYLCVCKF